MKINYSFIFVLIIGAFFIETSLGQSKDYVDHKPVYRKWQDDYIIDKIEYTKDRTIFYFRFVCKSGKSTSAIFYPPGGKHPWYLKGRDVRKNFYLKEIRDVRRNGRLMKSRVRSAPYSVLALDGIGFTVFSCEVHFDRLPNNIKVVDLIEGSGQEYNKNHFNCFRVKLKTWNDDDLGNTTYTTNDGDDPFPYEVDWWTVSSIFAKMQKIYIVAMTPKGVLNDVMETFFVFACCSHKSICSFLSCCNPFQYVYTFCCFWSCDKRIDTLKAFRVGVKIGLIFGGAGAAVGVGLGYLLSLTVLGCTMNLWTPGPGQRPRFSR